MELEKIKNEIKKMSINKEIDTQVAWDTFLFDEFINRLSKSEYKNNFIFKGGFYFQNVFGIETRSTMDIDFKYTGDIITNEKLYLIFSNIINVSNNDEVVFSIIDIDDIKAETKYGGKTVRIEANFYDIKKRFGIDIGIGDIVTPGPINYRYTTSITKKEFDILAYPIESAIAEKFETFVSKGVNNSRSKDLIDLYLMNKKGYNDDVLNSAIINTFYLRKTQLDKEIIEKTIEEVFSFERTKNLFDNYCHKNSFAKGIKLVDCKKAIESIFNKIKFKKKILIKDYDVELHVVRHGEDEQDKVGGWSDNHLTKNGIRQIENLKENIDKKYDIFICSDLNRTIETSKILNEKLNMKIEYNPLFRETNNGNFKNMSKDEFISKHKDYIFGKLKMNQSYPNGESPESFFNRIESAFINLLENNKEKKILLVTHGGVITIIYCLINGLEYSNLLKIVPSYGSLLVYK